MKVSGLEITESQALDVITTFLFIFIAVIIPGYIQMYTGLSAVKLSFSITMVYLFVHLGFEHYSEFKGLI